MWSSSMLCSPKENNCRTPCYTSSCSRTLAYLRFAPCRSKTIWKVLVFWSRLTLQFQPVSPLESSKDEPLLLHVRIYGTFCQHFLFKFHWLILCHFLPPGRQFPHAGLPQSALVGFNQCSNILKEHHCNFPFPGLLQERSHPNFKIFF